MEKGKIEFDDPNFKKYEETAKKLGKRLGLQNVTIEIKEPPPTQWQRIAALEAQVAEMKELLDNTHKINLDDGTIIYRGMIGYEVESDNEPSYMVYASLLEAFKAVKETNET